MKHNTFLYLLFFILSLVFMWLEISNAINYTCSDKERDALLNFKSHIQHDPYGWLSNWTLDEGANNDCCQWRRVTCDNQTGHVTGLDLDSGDLEGTISHSLLNLSYLNYLDLSFNFFNATIPKFIGSMSQLSSIDLGWNKFTGTIPSELGNLTNLQFLALEDLSNCTIENLDWVSHLSQLEFLYMSGTSLAKADNWVNVILSLQKLSYLSLMECDLSRVMHPYSHTFVSINSSYSSSIVTLDLENNNLNSSMYHWLFPLTSNKLEVLVLTGNKLDGIPKYLGNLCSLRVLYISSNSIAIKLSDFLDYFSGCKSVCLQSLNAAGNQFTGPLSDDIQKFQSLQDLDLSSNQLNGTTSEKIWQLPKLQSLNISFNSLSGTISKNNSKAKMSNLSSLQIVDLRSNNFYGHLPYDISSVEWLDFSKNKFYGGISFLCQTVNGSLQFLDLSDNSLSEQIPDCLWHFKELKILNLDQNNLFGRIPSSIEYLINLEVLNLYNNCFSGELPLTLKNYTNLTFLQLGFNKFSGYVPAWIGEKLTGLYTLSLTSNNFFGTIPSQLCHLVKLHILDFSMNKLHGTIPSCLNNFSAMVQVGLSYNKNFHYVSNYEFHSSSEPYLDHVMIKWQGSTREFSTTLVFVKSIDLSHNNLTGNIPNEIITLSELIVLDLSMNALSGDIPTEIGQMKKLLSLDVSRNNLSGEMPTSMSQMTLLNYLDVSHNNLVGKIPSGTQLQSFEPSRYTGNAGLCGLPLIKHCPGPKVPRVIAENEDGEEDKDDYENWFYFGMTTGFGIGFWTICSGLLLYRRGRHVFFQFMNSLEDWVYVKVMVFIVQCQRAANT